MMSTKHLWKSLEHYHNKFWIGTQNTHMKPLRLNTLPRPHKRGFRDAIALRYGWNLAQDPCGKTFTIQHVLSCPTGGYPIIHHNEIRDYFNYQKFAMAWQRSQALQLHQ